MIEMLRYVSLMNKEETLTDEAVEAFISRYEA